MNQQNNTMLEGVDCDSQVLNRPWWNVRCASSLRLCEIILKTTRGQIEPGKACSQQGSCQTAFKEKYNISRLTPFDCWKIFFHSVPWIPFILSESLTIFFPLPPTSIIQTPQADATCQKTRLRDLLQLFVLTDVNTCLFACWAVPLNACHLFQKNASIHVVLAVSYS